eukprot:4833634-Amphidinium_carterae.1
MAYVTPVAQSAATAALPEVVEVASSEAAGTMSASMSPIEFDALSSAQKLETLIEEENSKDANLDHIRMYTDGMTMAYRHFHSEFNDLVKKNMESHYLSEPELEQGHTGLMSAMAVSACGNSGRQINTCTEWRTSSRI